jgi:hypothetical protein
MPFTKTDNFTPVIKDVARYGKLDPQTKVDFIALYKSMLEMLPQVNGEWSPDLQLMAENAAFVQAEQVWKPLRAKLLNMETRLLIDDAKT